MKIRLIKEWRGNVKGKIVRGDSWKMKELIGEGYAIEYDGFLQDGENADIQDQHDKEVAEKLKLKTAKKEEKKKEVIKKKASGQKLIGE